MQVKCKSLHFLLVTFTIFNWIKIESWAKLTYKTSFFAKYHFPIATPWPTSFAYHLTSCLIKKSNFGTRSFSRSYICAHTLHIITKINPSFPYNNFSPCVLCTLNVLELMMDIILCLICFFVNLCKNYNSLIMIRRRWNNKKWNSKSWW
jgi:hypothetical protein